MATQLEPQPNLAPISISDPNSIVTPEYFRWFGLLQTQALGTVVAIGSPTELSSQSAAIPTAVLTLPAIQNGYVRISWNIRITTPDGVSSSVGLTIGFTEGVVSMSKTFAAITGDNVAAFGSDSVPFVLVGQNSTITYATSYASNTPNKMKYRLSIAVESV